MDVPTALNISRTNSLVRPQDRAVFHALAKQCQEELPLLRQKVEDAKRLLDMLEEKLAETEQGVLVCQSLSTPSHIRRLPPELLALVFTFACADDVLHVFSGSGQPLPTCLTLVRVCKYWRDLAFATKGVWDHFIFIKQDTWPFEDDYDPSPEINVLEGAVELYGKNLTHLYVDCQYYCNVNDELFDLMFGLQDQLVSLALVNGDEIFGFIDTFEMPMLEELFLLAQVNNHGTNGGEAFVEFDAPKLERVFLYCPEMELSIDNPSLPYHQISHLSLGSPCTMGQVDWVIADNFFDLLTQLPRLVSLHLSQISLQVRSSDQEPFIHNQPVITHEHLKHLELYDSLLHLFVRNDCILLPRISTPSLENLDLFFEVRQNHLNSEWHVALQDSFVPFIQRTPSLRQIRLVLMSDYNLGWSHPSRAIFFQFTGKTTFFALLSRIITDDEGDVRFLELSKRRRVPNGDWLGRDEVWTDKLIDRYIDQFPVVPWPMEGKSFISASRRFKSEDEDDGLEADGCGQHSVEEGLKNFHYEAEDRRTMKAIFAMLGDARIPSHVQRHVYLAF